MTFVLGFGLFALGALLLAASVLNWKWLIQPPKWWAQWPFAGISYENRRKLAFIYGVFGCLLAILLMTGIPNRQPAQAIPLKIVSTNMPVWQGNELIVNIQTVDGVSCYYIVDPPPPQKRDPYSLQPQNKVKVDTQGHAVIIIQTGNLTRGTHFLSVGVSKTIKPTSTSGANNSSAQADIIHSYVTTDFVVN